VPRNSAVMLQLFSSWRSIRRRGRLQRILQALRIIGSCHDSWIESRYAAAVSPHQMIENCGVALLSDHLDGESPLAPGGGVNLQRSGKRAIPSNTAGGRESLSMFRESLKLISDCEFFVKLRETLAKRIPRRTSLDPVEMPCRRTPGVSVAHGNFSSQQQRRRRASFPYCPSGDSHARASWHGTRPRESKQLHIPES
jgi:hypothetical protein